jgi:diguanylate cyclase (GGDEF)-like protein/PAS domain S-box-containing protein
MARAADLEGLTAIVVVDATGDDLPITFVSPGFELLTGYAAGEVLGRNMRLLQGPDTDPRALAVLREALREGREATATLLNYRADGTPFWNEISIAPERDAGGTIVRWLGVNRDVTDAMQVHARLHELAYYDGLTGLANRAALHDDLRSAMHRARVHETELALLVIDLDDFKHVNERWSHEAGDALLRVAADRLRSVVRPQDLLCRQGGDEFALLLKDLPAGDAERVAKELAARILRALRTGPLDVGDLRLDVRASIGVGLFQHGMTTAADLMRYADLALGAVKAAGKDGVRVHRPRTGDALLVPDDAFAPEAFAGALHRILAEGRVSAVFQPVVDLASRRTLAYEALARGPEGSALHRPDRLFAAAGAAGRTVELDWACRIAAVRAALDAGLGRDVSLFLNVEPSAVGTPCPDHDLDVWARAHRELDLVYEITERAVTDCPAELVVAVEDHRADGGGVALDDVGADVRSLALLPLIEPDVVKLDLRLVQDRPSTDQAAIVSAVAAERERTGAAVLAEGVETEEHAAVAGALGATLGQGWLWGRPGPLPAGGSVASGRVLRGRRPAAPEGRTPFAVVSAVLPTAEASKRLLLPMSHHLEAQTLRIGEGAVILSAFQEARHFTKATARRYETLARGASLVAAFGVGLGETPAHGVRGTALEADEALAGEWSVVVIGPHFTGALVGRDLGDTGPDRDRRFAFALTYDRALVLDAARTLMARIAPRAGVER